MGWGGPGPGDRGPVTLTDAPSRGQPYAAPPAAPASPPEQSPPAAAAPRWLSAVATLPAPAPPAAAAALPWPSAAVPAPWNTDQRCLGLGTKDPGGKRPCRAKGERSFFLSTFIKIYDTFFQAENHLLYDFKDPTQRVFPEEIE